jgi:hypothetical protein
LTNSVIDDHADQSRCFRSCAYACAPALRPNGRAIGPESASSLRVDDIEAHIDTFDLSRTAAGGSWTGRRRCSLDPTICRVYAVPRPILAGASARKASGFDDLSYSACVGEKIVDADQSIELVDHGVGVLREQVLGGGGNRHHPWRSRNEGAKPNFSLE